MEFGLVTICIGPCPLVFLARIPSLAATTICLIWLTRKIIGRNNFPSRLRIAFMIPLLLLSGVTSIVVNHVLFKLILNLIAGGGICTGFVHASVVEKCIPILGTLFVLTQKPNRRIIRFLHILSSLLFFAAVTVSLYHSILWNLVLYDAWGLNLDWPYHGDYGTYLKYENRINNFLTLVVTYSSFAFSFLYNRLLRFFKLRIPIVKVFLFVLGLIITWIIPLFCEIQVFESLAYNGFLFWVFPGFFVRMIAPLTFLFTWLVLNFSKADVYGFRTRLSKIKAVKKKTKFSLEQIKIASPCPASWEEMPGDDTVRFCQICSKNVYNLSSMSKVEAQTLVMNNRGKLCGLLYLRKDGSVMTSDCPVGFGEIRRRVIKNIAKVAGAAFALIGFQQLFVNGWNEELVPARQDKYMRETISTQREHAEEIIMGAIGYIEE
jgi:hypothetical protein